MGREREMGRGGSGVKVKRDGGSSPTRVFFLLGLDDRSEPCKSHVFIVTSIGLRRLC